MNSDNEDQETIYSKQFCCNCNSHFENMVIMACDHNLCLKCAYLNFRRDQNLQIANVF